MGASGGKQVSFRETVEHAMAACPVHHTRDQERVTHPGYVERFRTLYAKLTESSHEEEEAQAQADLEDSKVVSEQSDNDNDQVPVVTTPVTQGATSAPVVTLVTASGDRGAPEYSTDSPSRRDRRGSLGTPTAPLPRDKGGIKHGTSLTNLKVSVGHRGIIKILIAHCRVWPSLSTGHRSVQVRMLCSLSSQSLATVSSLLPLVAASTESETAGKDCKNTTWKTLTKNIITGVRMC